MFIQMSFDSRIAHMVNNNNFNVFGVFCTCRVDNVCKYTFANKVSAVHWKHKIITPLFFSFLLDNKCSVASTTWTKVGLNWNPFQEHTACLAHTNTWLIMIATENSLKHMCEDYDSFRIEI